MPQSPHTEKHFKAPTVVRDVVIGMADGLTVPFALAAGLSGAANSSALILTAGFAEIAAGAIAMGLGGYLAAQTDSEHFMNERAREERELREIPDVEAEEVAQIFRNYAVPETAITSIVASLQKDPKRFVDFMMKFELGIDPPDPNRARNSAITIASSYAVGGFVPLWPYILWSTATALWVSCAGTSAALLVFGYIKGHYTVGRPIKSAVLTFLIGAIAAAAAFGIARLLTF